MRSRGDLALPACLRRHAALGGFPPNREPLCSREAVHARMVHAPALTAQPHRDAPVPIARARLSHLPNLFPQEGLRIATSPIRISRPARRKVLTDSPRTDGKLPPPVIDDRSLLRRSPSVFRTTSWSMSLSKARSVTAFFSRGFSSSNGRSRFMSEGMRQPYLVHHR